MRAELLIKTEALIRTTGVDLEGAWKVLGTLGSNCTEAEIREIIAASLRRESASTLSESPSPHADEAGGGAAAILSARSLAGAAPALPSVAVAFHHGDTIALLPKVTMKLTYLDDSSMEINFATIAEKDLFLPVLMDRWAELNTYKRAEFEIFAEDEKPTSIFITGDLKQCEELLRSYKQNSIIMEGTDGCSRT